MTPSRVTICFRPFLGSKFHLIAHIIGQTFFDFDQIILYHQTEHPFLPFNRSIVSHFYFFVKRKIQRIYNFVTSSIKTFVFLSKTTKLHPLWSRKKDTTRYSSKRNKDFEAKVFFSAPFCTKIQRRFLP